MTQQVEAGAAIHLTLEKLKLRDQGLRRAGENDGRPQEEFMGSTYVALSDDELVERIRQATGELMIAMGTHQKTGHFAVGLRDQTTGAFLKLSTHTDKAMAEQAAAELEARLDRLAAEHPNFSMRNLMDEAGSGKGKRRH